MLLEEKDDLPIPSYAVYSIGNSNLENLLTQRMFMPYAYLKDEYPVLKKHKWLTPIYQAVRWFQMLRRKGGLDNSVSELKANVISRKNDAASVAEILKHLGL